MSRFRFCPRCATALEEIIDHEGRNRKKCPACGYVHYDNPTPVLAAIVEHEGHVILARNKGWPEDWYGLVTGFLEKDEEPAEGILREVHEELGLHGEIVSFVGLHTFRRMNQVLMTWHVRAAGEIVIGDELAGIKRILPEKVKPWPMGTGRALKVWLDQRQG
ncbi:MAG: NUDIX hydrolase [Myxococcota bacterium]